MNFNTILYRLGIDPSNFINKDNEPIKTEYGFIYDVEQRKDIRICQKCGSVSSQIKGYFYCEINCSETDHIKDTLRIKKVRFKCNDCNKTYTMPINGIEKYSKISIQTKNMIIKDFAKIISFETIAIRYGLTRQRILQLFDESVPFAPRKYMPSALCIDEIRFKGEYNQNYCCVLYDFNQRCIVDIIRNRQLAYLDEYFQDIKENERNNVKYFISDMYDAYKTVKYKYFSSSLHIVDLFHVITQLTRAVNKIRVNTMNLLDKQSIEYKFMKSYWRFFLCRKEKLPNGFYEDKKSLNRYHYDDMIFKCCIKNNTLLEAYNILQDLFHYNQKRNFQEAFDFVNYIADRLIILDNQLLIDVGNTYRKWSVEIANGLARSQYGKHYTNGIAESINNHLKTIIKVSYGYHNFERFRKRAMLISSYEKELTSS